MSEKLSHDKEQFLSNVDGKSEEEIMVGGLNKRVNDGLSLPSPSHFSY